MKGRGEKEKKSKSVSLLSQLESPVPHNFSGEDHFEYITVAAVQARFLGMVPKMLFPWDGVISAI